MKWDYYLLPRSVNLLDDFDKRWSYACAFGAITNTILFLFTGGQYMDFDGPTWSKGTL